MKSIIFKQASLHELLLHLICNNHIIAYRRKNEAKTPFIATSSRLNLGYIGRGYDIYVGNPVSDDGEVDQGFRLPVIDLPFSFRFTSDGGYRIPDNVDVISETRFACYLNLTNTCYFLK